MSVYDKNIIYSIMNLKSGSLKTEPQWMTLKGMLPYTVCSGSSSKLDGSSKLTTEIGKTAILDPLFVQIIAQIGRFETELNIELISPRIQMTGIRIRDTESAFKIRSLSTHGSLKVMLVTKLLC